MAKRFTVEAVFKAIDKFTAPVSRMQNSISKFTRKTERGLRSIDRRLGTITRGLKTVGVVGAASLALMSVAMADVIKTGAQFEQTLVNAGTRFQGGIKKGTEAFKKMEDAARQAGRTTEFTATEAASALNSMARAGFKVDDAINALPQIIDLATVAETDLATATDIATKSLGAFGLRSEDAVQQGKNFSRVIDVISLAANRGNTTIQDMFQAIKDGAPIARRAGFDIETTAALFAKLADAGIEGSKAGIAIKRIGLAIGAPGSKEAQIFQRLKVGTVDQKTGKIRDAVEVFKDLNNAIKGLDESNQLKVVEGIFGKIPIASAITFLEQAENIGKLREELRGADGVSKKWAATMRDTVLGQLKELNSAVESVKISIFSLSKGPLSELLTKMVDWVRANEKIIAQNIGKVFSAIFDNPEKIIFWAKAIGIVIGVLATLVISVKSLIAVITLFNLVMALNPIVLIIGLIGLLIFAISSIAFWFDEWTEALRNSSTAFKILFVAAGLILGPMGAIILLIALMVAHWDELSVFFEEIFTSMFITLDGWLDNVEKTFTSVWTGLKDFFVGIWDFMAKSAEFALAGILNVIDRVKIAWLEGQSLFAEGADLENITDQIVQTEIAINRRNNAEAPRLVAPGDDVKKEINETNTTSKTELTIKDETGKAHITGPSVAGISLQTSGGFD